MSKYHAFATHNWGKDNVNHKAVVEIVHALQALGVNVWIDEEMMTGRIQQKMTEGIDDSESVLVFITYEYINKCSGKGPNGDKDNCLKEFDYADRRKGSSKFVVVVMEEAMTDTSKWFGPVGSSLGGQLYINACGRDPTHTAAQIARELVHIVPGLKSILPKEVVDTTTAQAHAPAPIEEKKAPVVAAQPQPTVTASAPVNSTQPTAAASAPGNTPPGPPIMGDLCNFCADPGTAAFVLLCFPCAMKHISQTSGAGDPDDIFCSACIGLSFGLPGLGAGKFADMTKEIAKRKNLQVQDDTCAWMCCTLGAACATIRKL